MTYPVYLPSMASASTPTFGVLARVAMVSLVHYEGLARVGMIVEVVAIGLVGVPYHLAA